MQINDNNAVNKTIGILNPSTPKKYWILKFSIQVHTSEDYEVIKRVFEELYQSNPNFTAVDIIGFLDANQEVKKLNQYCVQQKYEYESWNS